MSAGTTSAADILVFADAAITLEKARVTELLEKRRLRPDLTQCCLSRVVGCHGEVAAGNHLSFVGHEAHA